MKRFLGVLAASLLISSLAMAAGPKEYQVTGPVLDVKDDVIVVQKDKDKWEIARTKDTKVTGDLKKGSKVMIKYTMTATDVENKDPKPKADAKTKADAKAKTEDKKTK
jgi:GH43 family beta-xylosidase